MRHLFKSLSISLILTFGACSSLYILLRYSFFEPTVTTVTFWCILFLLATIWLSFAGEAREVRRTFRDDPSTPSLSPPSNPPEEKASDLVLLPSEASAVCDAPLESNLESHPEDIVEKSAMVCESAEVPNSLPQDTVDEPQPQNVQVENQSALCDISDESTPIPESTPCEDPCDRLILESEEICTADTSVFDETHPLPKTPSRPPKSSSKTAKKGEPDNQQEKMRRLQEETQKLHQKRSQKLEEDAERQRQKLQKLQSQATQPRKKPSRINWKEVT